MKSKLFDLVRGRLGGFCLSVMFLLTSVLVVHSASFAAVEEIATGLITGPTRFLLDGNDLYFATGSPNSTLNKVARSGGMVTTLLSGLTLPDGGVNGMFAADSSNIYGGYGGYAGYNIFKVPKGGGSITNLISITGGVFSEVAGNYLYYSSGFSSINRMSNEGSGSTTILSGYWVRSVAMDSTGIYFVDYYSKDVKKFDLNTSSLSTLISGNSS